MLWEAYNHVNIQFTQYSHHLALDTTPVSLEFRNIMRIGLPRTHTPLRSDLLLSTKRVSQGAILGPLLYVSYISCMEILPQNIICFERVSTLYRFFRIDFTLRGSFLQRLCIIFKYQ